MTLCEQKLEESLRIQRDTQRLMQALISAIYGNKAIQIFNTLEEKL